jgi:hypothetical protein
VITKAWLNDGADIHITHREGTKEQAIAQLLKLIHVARDRAVGVGDGDNDIYLFNAVGKRIAMRNATDRLKSLADEVCESVDNDGLAEVIERVLASRQ